MNQTPQDIQQIEKRIKEFRKTNSPQKKSAYISAYQLGTRIAAELVSGVLVGAGLGYLLDKVFRTAPIFLIILLILGSIAGFLNVYRFAKKEDRKGKSHV